MPQINRNKTEVLSVSIPKQLKRNFIKLAKDKDTTVSQLTKEVFRSYILRSELERLQGIFGPAIKKLGIKSDEDVEKYFG